MLSKEKVKQDCLFIAFELQEMNKDDKLFHFLKQQLNCYLYILDDDIPTEWYEMNMFIKLGVFDF